MAIKKYNGLNSYLNDYYKNYQKEILLVYRGEEKGDWANRCMYLSKEYSPMVKYNHRWILEDEIVIEYDNEDKDLNKRLVARVVAKLNGDNIKYSKWFSGGKSTHLHFIMKKYDLANRALFKKALMEYYGTYYYDMVTHKIYNEYKEGLKKLTCDLRLSGSHLIRAEYGVHERTQDTKTLISKSTEYPCRSNMPMKVFEYYQRSMEHSVRTRVGQTTVDLTEHDLVKQLMDTVKFQAGMNDGRERVMWQLIHVLKPKYKPNNDMDGMVELLEQWYNYCSTQPRKMSKADIKAKVRYHWSRNYVVTIETLKATMEEIGGSI